MHHYMIPGSKGHKSDASLLPKDFELGPAKSMSKKPFFEENERITNVLSESAKKQFGIEGAKYLLPPNGYINSSNLYPSSIESGVESRR